MSWNDICSYWVVYMEYCTEIHTYIYMYSTYTHIYVYTYVHIYKYICTYICIYVWQFINTEIHIFLYVIEIAYRSAIFNIFLCTFCKKFALLCTLLAHMLRIRLVLPYFALFVLKSQFWLISPDVMQVFYIFP